MLVINFGCYNKLLEGEHDWRCDFCILGMWDIEVVNLLLIFLHTFDTCFHQYFKILI